MQTLKVDSRLEYRLPNGIIGGTVEIGLSGRRTAFDLEVLNPGPESAKPPETRFSRDGIEVLVLIPGVTDKYELDLKQRALLSISEPMFDAGARVYAEAQSRFYGFISGSKETMKTMGVEVGIGRTYVSEYQIDDDFAGSLEPLFA